MNDGSFVRSQQGAEATLDTFEEFPPGEGATVETEVIRQAEEIPIRRFHYRARGEVQFPGEDLLRERIVQEEEEVGAENGHAVSSRSRVRVVEDPSLDPVSEPG